VNAEDADVHADHGVARKAVENGRVIAYKDFTPPRRSTLYDSLNTMEDVIFGLPERPRRKVCFKTHSSTVVTLGQRGPRGACGGIT
jgi:hypothetical protein